MADVMHDDSSDDASASASSSANADDDFGGLRARAAAPKPKHQRQRKRPRQAQQASDDAKVPGANMQPGAWEKHTRGIGSKLLAKMGFTGRLGARADGISEPIFFAPRANPTAGLGMDTGRAALARPRAAPPPHALQLKAIAERLQQEAEAHLRTATDEAQRADARVQATREEVSRCTRRLNEMAPKPLRLRALADEMRQLAHMQHADAHPFAKHLTHHCPSLRSTLQAVDDALTPPARLALCEVATSAVRHSFRSALRGSPSEARKAADVLRATRAALGDGAAAESAFVRLCSRSVLREARACAEPCDDAVLRSFAAVREAVHPDVLTTFTLEVLLPALNKALLAGAPPHQAVHPWLPVVGTRIVPALWPALGPRLRRIAESWRNADDTRPARHLALWSAVVKRRLLTDAVAPAVTPRIAALLEDAVPHQRAQLAETLAARWAPLCGARATTRAVADALWADVARLRDLAFADDAGASAPATAAAAAALYRAWRRAAAPLLKHVRPILAAMLFVLHAERTSRADPALRAALRAADLRVLATNGYSRTPATAAASTKAQTGDVTARRLTVRAAIELHVQRNGLLLVPEPRDRDGRERFRVGRARFVVDGARQVVLHATPGGLAPVGIERLLQLARGE